MKKSIITLAALIQAGVAYADTPADTVSAAAPVTVAQASDEAKQAYAEACAALDKKQFEHARIFLMSAINKSPNQFMYYRKLYEAATANPQMMDMEELSDIIRIGVYQVDHADTLKMYEMEQTLNKTAQAKIESFPVPAAGQLIRQLQQDFSMDKLLAEAATKEQQLTLCAKRMELLEMIDATQQNQVDVPKEKKRTTAAAGYIEIAHSLSTIKRNIETGMKQGEAVNMPMLNALIQSAANLIAQASAIDYTILPETCRRNMESWATDVQHAEEFFNKMKSKPILEQIQKISPADYKIEGKFGKYTQKILAKQKAIEDITKKLPLLQDSESVATAQEKIKQLAAEISQDTEARLMAYQADAIKTMSSIYSTYSANRYVTDKDAMDYLEALAPIKVSVLTPETLSLYQDLLAILNDQLPASKRVKCERTIATHQKDDITSK